jgi:hypothetical protein
VPNPHRCVVGQQGNIGSRCVAQRGVWQSCLGLFECWCCAYEAAQVSNLGRGVSCVHASVLRRVMYGCVIQAVCEVGNIVSCYVWYR